MPIYEFECTNCGERFDRLQKLSDPDPEICPHCGQPKIKRRLTAPAFRLAGSGWYETDFKKDGDKKRNLAEKSEGGSSSGDSAKIESKSDSAKTESAKPTETSTPASKAKPEGSAGN
jgi:putative FmdB family regulatory protein